MSGDAPRPRLLVGGAQAFPRMLQLIAAATGSVDLEVYIWRDDAVGTRFRDALQAAAGRGVQVRVLVDALGSDELPDDYWQVLRRAGASCRRFNPRRGLRGSFRNHRKLLRVDGVAIVGGLNLGCEYDGDGVVAGWRDFAVELDGEVVEALTLSFDRLWALAPFGARQWRALGWFLLQPMPSTDEVASARLLLSGLGFPSRTLRQSLIQDLRTCRQGFAWAAYLLPTRGMLAALCQAAAAPGGFALLTGTQSDVPLAQWASERRVPRLLRAGLRLFQYPLQMVHAKVLVLDDVVYMGSANLDVRSLRINFELLLRLECPALAAELRALFAADVQRSSRVEARAWQAGRGLWQRLRSWIAWQLLARFDPWLARRQMRSLR